MKLNPSQHPACIQLCAIYLCTGRHRTWSLLAPFSWQKRRAKTIPKVDCTCMQRMRSLQGSPPWRLLRGCHLTPPSQLPGLQTQAAHTQAADGCADNRQFTQMPREVDRRAVLPQAPPHSTHDCRGSQQSTTKIQMHPNNGGIWPPRVRCAG